MMVDIEVTPPTRPTLDKYGFGTGEYSHLSPEEDWLTLFRDQGETCFVCETLPPSKRLVVDHYHAKGWKKMAKNKRRLYVRGLLCWTCNHYLVGRGVSIQKSKRVTKYLEGFKQRMTEAGIEGLKL